MPLLMDSNFAPTIHAELSWCLSRAKAQVVRPISQWVEDELIIPDGPFKGERYRHARHPASRLWFEALDSGLWNRAAATGPTQNGKSLMCWVAPILYHLFELQETVVAGMPTMAMANDKWQQDLLPAIMTCRYQALLPKTGEGSRGGLIKTGVIFQHGAQLRMMSGGGDDKQRAGFTTRVAAVTEVDGMDVAGEASREADKIEQIEGRTRAHGSNKRIYLECTVSIEKGRIWQEIKQGSDSRIARQCPHCLDYVTPEREHLVGWEDAESELEASDKASWCCPACGEYWTEEQRLEAAQSAVLVHRGQKVLQDGSIIGPLPQTKTLGFRWSAIDNPFATAAELGAEEWRASRSFDRENAEKKMRQFVWALPYVPPAVELIMLDPDELQKRKEGWSMRELPDDTIAVSVGIDTGKMLLHWHVLAIRGDGRFCVVEYGEQPTEADKVGTKRGLMNALLALKAYFSEGWTGKCGTFLPAQVWIDSGWSEHKIPVYEFCRHANEGAKPGSEIWRPTKGYGENQKGMTKYYAPQAKNNVIRYIGREFDVRKQASDQVLVVHVNADYWKSQLHQGLAMDSGSVGAIALYASPNPQEHFTYSQHITAEVQEQKFIPGSGEVTVFRRIRRANHFLDAAYLSLAAADFVNAELERQRRVSQRRKTPAGQPSRAARQQDIPEQDEWISY